jgi:hypothetical protein
MKRRRNKTATPLEDLSLPGLMAQLVEEPPFLDGHLMKIPRPRSSKSKPKRGALRQLVWVDDGPLRAEALAAFDSLADAIRELEARLRVHEQRDQPAFNSWFHGQFGALLTRLRELDEIICRQAKLVERTMVLQSRGLRTGEAFDLATREQEEQGVAFDPYEGEDDDEPLEPEPENVDFDKLSDIEKKLVEGMYEAMSNQFEWENGVRPPAFEHVKHDLNHFLMGGRTSAVGNTVKSLFRQIAKLLHPDSACEFTKRESDLWHEAQEAYHRGDQRSLEIILSRCRADGEGEGNAHISSSTLGEIQQWIRRRESEISHLRFKLSLLEKQPAWNFTEANPKALGKLHRQANAELQREWRRMEDQMLNLQNSLAHFASIRERWLAAKSRPKCKRKSKNPAR